MASTGNRRPATSSTAATDHAPDVEFNARIEQRSAMEALTLELDDEANLTYDEIDRLDALIATISAVSLAAHLRRGWRLSHARIQQRGTGPTVVALHHALSVSGGAGRRGGVRADGSTHASGVAKSAAA